MTRSFSRIACGSAAVAVVTSLVYSVTFALVVRKGYRWAEWTSSAALLTGGLAAIVVVIAAREHFAGREAQLAQLAAALGLAGALGSALHAAYDLSTLTNPESSDGLGLSPVDPRGFATFALTGLSLAVFGVLGHEAGVLSSRTRLLSLLTGASLVALFVGRLVYLDPNRLGIKLLALVSGLFLNPLVLALFGRSFLSRSEVPPPEAPQAAPAVYLARQPVGT
jgi:hypothetical protein